MITRICFLLVALSLSARADYFNFRGDPSKDNPMDSNEGGAAVGTALGLTKAALEHGALKQNWQALTKFEGVSATGEKLLPPSGAMGNAAKILDRAGPLIDHAGWLSTAAGEVTTGHLTQGLLTAINGIAKSTATGLAAAVGASAGSLGGPAGTVVGGGSAGYAASVGWDAKIGIRFEKMKEDLGKKEDAAQIKGLASDKMNLGSDPDKTLAETHVKYQAFVQARKDQEKAEAEKKIADAKAAEAAKKLAETKAAEAAKAAKLKADSEAVAKQKAEGEAARQRLKAAVADSKWESTATLACVEFWAFLSAPVPVDSVGHEDPARDTHTTKTGNMELKIKDGEKRGKDCFWIKGTSFDHEFQREAEWHGSTAHYRIHGEFTKDMSAIAVLTISCKMDSFSAKNRDGSPGREMEKSWSATIINIPRSPYDRANEYNFVAQLKTKTMELPKDCRVTQSEYIETDTLYEYTRLRADDEKATLTATVRTSAGAWDVTRPKSNVDITIRISKRPGM